MQFSLIAFIKKYRYVFLLIGMQFFVFYNWIFTNRIFTFGDIGIYPPEVQKGLIFSSRFFYSGNSGFGDVNITASNNPILLLYGFLGRVGVNEAWSEKLLFFFPIVFGVVLTSYFFIRYLTKSEKGAFIGAIVYSYSVYFLVTLTGALYISLAYAFAPLVFLAFLKVFDCSTIRRQIALAFLAAGLGYIEFRILYVIGLMMAGYFFLYLFMRRASLRRYLDCARRFILSGTIFFLLNLFWLLPILSVNALKSNDLFDRELFGDNYFDIVNALTVFHPWWTWNVPSIFVKQTASPLFFLVVIFIGGLFLTRRQNIKISVFLVLFLLGVFLTKQCDAPFGALYQWLFNNFPGFNAFRESSKFFLISSFSLSVLVGYFFSTPMNADGRTLLLKKLFVKFAWLAVFLIQFFSAKTIATGAIGTMFIPRDIPEEYEYLNEFIRSSKEYSRILWFPHTNRFGFYSDSHPAVSMLTELNDTYDSYQSCTDVSFETCLYSSFEHTVFDSLLDRQSVKYIVIPSNLVWDEVDSQWKNPDNYVAKFDTVPYLKRVGDLYFEKNHIFIYENENYRPHIYLTEKEETLYQDVSFKAVEYYFENPTEYRVTLEDISSPVWVNFSEAYHPDWKVRVGNFSWWDALRTPEYFLSDARHMENDAKLNSFLIDPREACEENACRKNSDESVDMDLTIYFRSQSYFYLGLVVSGVTLAGSLGYLGWHRTRKWRLSRKKEEE